MSAPVIPAFWWLRPIGYTIGKPQTATRARKTWPLTATYRKRHSSPLPDQGYKGN